jgi:hypothetical protein
MARLRIIGGYCCRKPQMAVICYFIYRKSFKIESLGPLESSIFYFKSEGDETFCIPEIISTGSDHFTCIFILLVNKFLKMLAESHSHEESS